MLHAPLTGHQVVCSAFIEKENQFLIVMCPKYQVWRIPGGRPEHGERIEQTLLREMQEETGIEFENPLFLGWGQDQQFRVQDQCETSRLIMFFHLKTSKDPVLDPQEAEAFRWVSFEELKQIENKEGALTDLFLRNPSLNLSQTNSASSKA